MTEIIFFYKGSKISSDLLQKLRNDSDKRKIPKNAMNCKTHHKSAVLSKYVADEMYKHLLKNIVWEDGVRSKKGFTRKAKSVCIGYDMGIDLSIYSALSNLAQYEYYIGGIYLNYYEDGNMWTPNHTHPGSHQMVISLGAPRTLKVASKDYLMSNGDAIIFGSSIHGVPKDPDCKEGRISIAVFMTHMRKIENPQAFYKNMLEIITHNSNHLV
jgi:hypothetical protein